MLHPFLELADPLLNTCSGQSINQSVIQNLPFAPASGPLMADLLPGEGTLIQRSRLICHAAAGRVVLANIRQFLISQRLILPQSQARLRLRVLCNHKPC